MAPRREGGGGQRAVSAAARERAVTPPALDAALPSAGRFIRRMLIRDPARRPSAREAVAAVARWREARYGGSAGSPDASPAAAPASPTLLPVVSPMLLAGSPAAAAAGVAAPAAVSPDVAALQVRAHGDMRARDARLRATYGYPNAAGALQEALREARAEIEQLRRSNQHGLAVEDSARG